MLAGQHLAQSKKSEENNMFTIWMTGLSGSGKTTIAEEFKKIYKNKILHLDGNKVRRYVNADLKFSIEEREQHLKRIIGICILSEISDIPCIVSTISPLKSIRTSARENLENFIEVYIKCPIAVCEERDPRGLYKSNTTEMIGKDLPYQAPTSPDIVIETNKESVEEAVSKILDYLEKNNLS